MSDDFERRMMTLARFTDPSSLAAINGSHHDAAVTWPSSYGTDARDLLPSSDGGPQRQAREPSRPRPAPPAGTGSGWPPPLDLAVLAQQAPLPPAFIIDDWLPCGCAALLAGHGGSGKSYIGLDLAVRIASGGLKWAGLSVRQRRVLYLSCEDRQSVLHWRLHHICRRHRLDMATLAGSLDVRDLVGHDSILWRGGTAAPAFGELAAQVRRTGAEVLIIDGITDTFGGDENSRSEVKAFVNGLLGLIDGATGAVVLMAHVNKLAAGGMATSEGYSGSTAWHNAVRARWYLRPEVGQDDDGTRQKTGALQLELQKSNLGRADQALTFRWDDAARVFVDQVPEGGALASALAANREAAERDSILAALRHVTERGDYVPAASTGSRTAYHVLSATNRLADSLLGGRANKRRFWRHIEQLRAMQHAREGFIRRPDGHKTITLELGSQ